MKMRMGGFLLPSASASIDTFERGFAGQNPNHYQRALKDCGRIVRQLEDLGFDFVAFSEHHFHLEGLELSNNPVMLGAWAAMQTSRILIGQMGNVLPARNPLLLAEDLAMLDHFSEGRMIAGFARGYQARHVATIGQKYNAYSTAKNDPEYAEHDRTNRELFVEHYDIVRKAWGQRLFRHEGKHWQLPPPGVHWDHPATKDMAPGMVGANGELDQIGIAPQTLQDPDSIEVFIPFTMSPETIEWSAREGVKPVIFSPIEEIVRGCLDLYQNAARDAGRDLAWGKGVGHFRDIVVADTEAEAHHIQENGLGYIWTRWHDWFGFNEALRRPGEEGALPNTAAFVRERGYSLCGTVDQVTRQLEHMIETLQPELIVPWIAAGPTDTDALLRSNELLVEKVLPLLGIELEQTRPVLRAEFNGVTWRGADSDPAAEHRSIRDGGQNR
ncbi:MAG: LLM class flavin-dependent oxidoreductase [Gammaproteobacteria bacterium]|jgi:alkanesulfonate monooxygenase SsuD/methylene tetrahydromethanopterin reductase-like flavin-dependent oxidoreductase (luciferase family)